MSLELYKKKRDFKVTPEPASGRRKRKSALTFVVQRHDASRLHYDFRLEMEGVLKSWAVPKGPSMFPGERRLAIMVEDHPLPYGEFYGEIPEGNYGAGTVEIWDEGTYQPLKEKGDPENNLLEQLKQGDLKFVLSGKYLKGAFALVRIKNTEKENEWLLIKKKDEFSVDTYDIETIQPVKSKLTNELKPSENKKPKPPKKEIIAEKPGNFQEEIPKPMLARLIKQVIDKPDWIYEMKYDGYRLISRVNERKVALLSRNGNNFNKLYPLLANELTIIEDDVTLDGEVVIENNKGLSDFQLLQNYRTTQKGVLKYYVFDMLYLNGHSVTEFTLSDRKELLNAFFKKYKFKNVHNAPFQIGNGRELYEKLSAEGYEGIIAKAPDSRYLPGQRTDSWVKIKTSMMQETIICGYTLPQNSRKYFGSLILGLFDEQGGLKFIGNCGTGFNDTSLRELHTEFELLKTDSCPFEKIPKLTYTKGKPVWLKPELVCNVKFLEWSQDEHMRNPVYMGLRIDKDPSEVVNESKTGILTNRSGINESQMNTVDPGSAANHNKAVDENKQETKKMKPELEKEISISGKTVKCTNLTKVYWPEEGYTKSDLISYYQDVSTYILPYLKNRPQSLNRHPGGITGKSFYQKDMEISQLPKWVKTVKIYSKSNDDTIDYLICNDAATLIYMANLGCIEINPWHSTYLKPDQPTYMMLDLDPGDISFTDVVNTALVIKEICDEIGIPCYCKTSGATGLHIYIPFAAKYSYDQLKNFGEIMAVITHNRLPSTTSIERSVAKRKDKIYIDFLQNRKGQTIAAAYSVRPRAHATVSAPLQWSEVNHQLSPEMFTIKNMLQRLSTIGDLWQPVLKNWVNLNPVLKKLEKL